jgi:hypothetical protein
VNQPARVFVTVPSAFFKPNVAYQVRRWHEDAPQVANEVGSFTWLLDARQWAPAHEPLTLARSQELLHARYRASRAQ